MVSDRRVEPRADLETTAIVLARHNPGVLMVIESLSVSGARLVGPSTFGVGERIQILFELEGAPLDVSGEVIRVERRDMVNDRIAVRFVAVGDASTSVIRRLVKHTLDLEELRLLRNANDDS